MAAIKGPALVLAQFVQDTPLFNTLENMTPWAKDVGFPYKFAAGAQDVATNRHILSIAE